MKTRKTKTIGKKQHANHANLSDRDLQQVSGGDVGPGMDDLVRRGQ